MPSKPTMKSIIFDMDGVLVDSEPYHVEIEKRLFDRFKLNISDEEHKDYMGKASDVMWSEIIRNKNLPLNVDEMVELNYKESKAFFSGLSHIDPMPGAFEMLEELYVRSIPMAVASSSDNQTVDLIMDKSGLKKYFRHIVSSSLIGKSKPEPDIFLYTAKLLNTLPEKCIVVEDSTNGIKAAKAAKMFCVAYKGLSSENQNHNLADEQITDFGELKAILNKYFEI